MLSGLGVPEHRQTASKRTAVYFACVLVSILSVVLLGFHGRLQAPGNIPADRRISTVPAEIQPEPHAGYGKLPLGFETNQGQTDARVRFLARGGGYTIFLTGDEAVLALRKSQPGVRRLGKLGFPGRPEPPGPVDVPAWRWPSLSDDLKSLRRSLIPDLGQMVPDPSAGRGGVAAGLESEPPQVMRMRLVGGSDKGRVVGLDELPGRSNYFIGNNAKKWRTNVPSYARVKYEGVYPGVDLVYYGNQRQLEYDFVVEPSADPNQIKLSFAGADGMRVDASNGDLVVKVGADELHFHKPAVYQPPVAAVSSPPSSRVAAVYDRRRRSQSAATVELEGAFVVASNNQVAFRVAGYDPKRALVIDPLLVYSTYLGGNAYDNGTGIAVDSSGNVYVTGCATSADFPTENPLQATLHGVGNAFVAKLNAAGSALVYSTYLGGSGGDSGFGVAVDSSGSAYVTGDTTSTDFPTANPLQATNKAGTSGNPSLPSGTTGFVTKLNPSGSALVYSTYLGGSGVDQGLGIAVDPTGNTYVTGDTTSTDFPTVNPIQATNNAVAGTAFVAKLNGAGSALVYSTYLGGSSEDGGRGITVDATGNAYVTGFTESTNFPTVNPIQANCEGCISPSSDAFVSKLNSGGSALAYSTYLGGGIEYYDGGAIGVDSSGNAYVVGGSNLAGSAVGAVVTKLNAAGSALVYSTSLLTVGAGSGIAVDSYGDAYVTGLTNSTDFPTVNAIQATCACSMSNSDAFVAMLNPAGSALVYSTYLGGSQNDSGTGIAVDPSGNAYVTGLTTSTDFPTVDPLQVTGPRPGGYANAFVAKISSAVTGPAVSLSAPLTFSAQLVGTTSGSQTITLSNTGNSSLTLSAVAVTFPFAIAASGTTCSTSTPVAAAATCTVAVTFTPTAAGAASGSLSFSDNAPNSPQTIALSGTGQDFTLAVSSGSPTSDTVAPGQPATYTLTTAGEGGFNQSVSLTCTGAPSEATCTVPTPVTVGSPATNITVSVTTTAPSFSAPRSRPLPPVPPVSPGLRGLLMLALALAGMAWVFGRRNQPGVSGWRSALVPLASALLLTLALAGCGGGGSSASTNV